MLFIFCYCCDYVGIVVVEEVCDECEVYVNFGWNVGWCYDVIGFDLVCFFYLFCFRVMVGDVVEEGFVVGGVFVVENVGFG